MERRIRSLSLLLACFVASSASAAEDATAESLPKEWSGHGGWAVVPEATKIHQGPRGANDVLIEYQLVHSRTGVLKETARTKYPDGREFVIPEGTKLFAQEYKDLPATIKRWHGAPLEWCAVLPRGIDGKQDIGTTGCFLWKDLTQVVYVPDDRTGGFRYMPLMDPAKGALGPMPRIEEGPVDLGVKVLWQTRLLSVTSEHLEISETMSDGTSESTDPTYRVPWDKDRKVTLTSEGQEFEVTASEDFTRVELRHIGPATRARDTPPEPPIVKVCVNERGEPQGEPEIATTSGSAQMDAAALKVAKAGRYKGQQGVARCFRYRVRFEFKD